MRTTRFKDMMGIGHIGIIVIIVSLIIGFVSDYYFKIAKLQITTMKSVLIGLLLLGLGYFIINNAVKVLPLEKRSRILSRKGVYGFVRHPTYSAIIFLIYPAIALLAKSKAVMYSTLVLLFAFYFLIRKEEKYMVYIFREEYEHYQTETPPFFPRIYKSRFWRKLRNFLLPHTGTKGYLDLSKK